jgi:hypothetical protein
MPHRIYSGTAVYFIRSHHPHLCKSLPSSHTSPLGYFDRVIFKLQAFRWKRRARYLGHRGNRQVKIDKILVRGNFGGVATPKIP